MNDGILQVYLGASAGLEMIMYVAESFYSALPSYQITDTHGGDFFYKYSSFVRNRADLLDKNFRWRVID